jgi:hypothetical protein
MNWKNRNIFVKGSQSVTRNRQEHDSACAGHKQRLWRGCRTGAYYTSDVLHFYLCHGNEEYSLRTGALGSSLCLPATQRLGPVG